jgi:excisionase family DNA binding protein
MATEHEIMTVKEVCELLQVDRTTIYRLIRQGRIQFPNRLDWRFRKDGIVRWMVEQTKGGPQ